jgi:hypothetical protein
LNKAGVLLGNKEGFRKESVCKLKVDIKLWEKTEDAISQ